MLELWLTYGAVALIASLVSHRGKRLGDVFAGTIVIGERGPRETPPPPMPPGLETWARSLELSRLPDELANAARAYLTRWHQLAPHVRDGMGAQIASQVGTCVAPPPPPNVPPNAYLAAVLAERRRRAVARFGTGHPATTWPQPGATAEVTREPSRDGFAPPP